MLRKNSNAIWGAFLYYKIFVHIFFLAMCTCAQKFLGRVQMRIRVVSTKKACLIHIKQLIKTE